MSEPEQFRKALIEAVDHGLIVLGAIVRQTIYGQIENHHALKRTEILNNLKSSIEHLGACSE